MLCNKIIKITQHVSINDKKIYEETVAYPSVDRTEVV